MHGFSAELAKRQLRLSCRRLNRPIFPPSSAFPDHQVGRLPLIDQRAQFSAQAYRIADQALAQTPIQEICIFKYRVSGKRLSRFDIAERVVTRYPVLGSRLPSRRKLGYGEPFQVRMFNAISAAIAFRRRL
jgi:hypothetical protein